MGNPGAQHELACTLVQRYPNLALRLGEIAGVKIPSHDLVVTSSNEHQLPNRPPLATDGTVRFLRDGKPAFFAQVEVQGKHDEDKFATLRAYYGSEVSKAQAGGHMIVVSPKAAEAEKFRRSELERGEEYTFRGSYMSSEDLESMAEDGRPFEERCFAIGMSDLTGGAPPATRAMLREATDRDATVANLFFRAIFEEAKKMSMVRDVLEPDLLEKLRELESFRDYEARVKATADAEAKAAAEAEAAKAAVAAEARVAAAALEATLKSKADDLTGFFYARGDKPSAYAFAQISGCRDVAQLTAWLSRAFAGETAAEIFPEP